MVMQTVREAIGNALSTAMREDPDVFLIGEDIGEYQGAYKITQGLLEEFGDRRVVDAPITEHGFTGLAVGAAFSGLKPVVEFMTFNFSMQAMDQIINSAAKTHYMSGGRMSCPIVFRGPNGAAAQVAAQHSQDFSSWFAHVPGLKVVQPCMADDAAKLLINAIRDPDPVIFLENEILYNHTFEVDPESTQDVPIGKARVVTQGRDITLVASGISVLHIIEAEKQLREMGISAEVIDLRTLRPLDKDTVIQSVRKTGRCLTVEEGWPVCSIGNYIAAFLMEEAFDCLDAPVLNITGKDVPMPYASSLVKLVCRWLIEDERHPVNKLPLVFSDYTSVWQPLQPHQASAEQAFQDSRHKASAHPSPLYSKQVRPNNQKLPP
jgi:pyruvate dehydrogenase E1 component beta subunit